MEDCTYVRRLSEMIFIYVRYQYRYVRVKVAGNADIIYCMRGLRVELSNTSNYCFISAYYAQESTIVPVLTVPVRYGTVRCIRGWDKK